MANFYRLTLAVLALLAGSAASAATWGGNVYWTGVSSSQPSVVYPSASAACAAWNAGYTGAMYRNVSLTSVTEGECRNAYQQDSFGRWVDGSGRIDVRIGVNRCGAGKVPPTCEAEGPPPDAHKQSCYMFSGLETLPGGFLVQDQVLSGRVDHGKTFCLPLDTGAAAGGGRGCRIKFSMQMVASNPDGSSTSYGTFNMDPRPGAAATNGVPDYTCTAGDGTTSDSKPAEPPCKEGSQGTVNGVTVCVPRQPDNGVTTGVDGTQTEVKPDGSKTDTRTQTETTCNATTCTTTTTVTTTNTSSGGQAGTPTTTTTTTSTPRGEYCKTNQKAAQCTGAVGGGGGSGGGGSGGDGDGDDPSKFGGSCGAWTCEGDAIMCAIAKEQHKRACELYDAKDSPEYKTYGEKKSLTGKVTGDLEGNREVDIGSIVSTADQFLGSGGSCPADTQISVGQFGSFVISWSLFCPWLALLGHVGVICSAIGAAFIVVGRGA